MDEKSLAATRFQFAQSVFNHKVQEKAADRKFGNAKWFKIIQLVLTAVVIAVLVAQAAGCNNAFVNIVGIVSGGVELIFLIVDLTYGFEKQAAGHRSYALKFLDLRVQYQALIADIMAKQGVSQINNAKRDALDKAYSMLSDAPHTTLKDYKNAQASLGTEGESGGEQYTWSDKEINKFLTPQLRYSPKTSSKK
ncbi:MAG TPA: SLATT domain-containing protein [Candidatus Saccharimonadales bacterium]|nr:SLATT domain-containing protein [Candidatus Saccharimonadales bacterium]